MSNVFCCQRVFSRLKQWIHTRGAAEAVLVSAPAKILFPALKHLKTHSVLFLALPLLVSCSQTTYQVNSGEQYLAQLPESFITPSENSKIDPPGKWYHSFNDPHLNKLIEAALSDNFSLKQYYARLVQAQAAASKVDAQRYPEISGEISGDRFFFNDREDIRSVRAQFGTSWEVDLWNRLSSAAEASRLEALASSEELEAASLQLSSEVATTYFSIIEQNGQLQLAIDQLSTNQRILDILQGRFILGGSSLLDIYQQREQLVSTRSNLPQISSRITELQYRLSVLLGRSPEKQIFTSINALPQLPPSPETGVPAELLLNRPDLRAIVHRLHAAGFQIDRAKAERLPRIVIGGDSGLRGSSLTTEDLFLSLFGELIVPIFDWGERRSELLRTKARYAELSAALNQSFLRAIEEVQVALWKEYELHTLIATKQEQLQIAEAALKESQLRYLQGVIDYLPSLTSLFSVQRLEREIITLKRELVEERISLYQAIGSTKYLYGS